MKRRIMAGTVALLLALLAGCREHPARETTEATRVTPVEIATPRVVEAGEPVSTIGRLEAADETRLAFKSAGVVARLLVDIGDRVEPGQLLAELELTELDSALTRSREALAKAERDLARTGELVARQLVAREQLDNARTARELAAADFEAAQFNRRFAGIRASGPGRVLARYAEPRQVVAAGEPVLGVSGETRGWQLRVEVSDREVVRIEPGASAEVRFDAFPGRVFAARVARIAARAEPLSATFALELALDESEPRLLSGLIGQARITARAEGEALLVPLSALVDADAGSAKLYVAADGRARARTVRTGRLRADGILVLDGLEASEQVIVGGAAWIDDGSAVRAATHEG